MATVRKTAVKSPATKAAPKAAPKSAPKAESSPRSRKAASASAATAPAKPAKADKAYAPIPEDAFLYETGEKTVFVATYTSFKDDSGKMHDSIVFTKGYKRNDGQVTLTGRSATLPQSFMKGAKGKKFREALCDWLGGFA